MVLWQPPFPVLVLAGVVLGWPALKLLATLVSRPLWRSAERLRSELLSDDRYVVPTAREAIASAYREGTGDPLFVLMPLVLLVGLPISAIASFLAGVRGDDADPMLFRRRPHEAHPPAIGTQDDDALRSLSRDWRFRLLETRAFELGMLRYPLTSLFCVLAALVASPFLIAAFGFRSLLSKLLSAVATTTASLRTLHRVVAGAR